MVSAGELSGDMHAADVITALRQHYPALRAAGLGGDSLEAAGVTLIQHCANLAVIGFTDVLRRLPEFLWLIHRLKREVARRQPDLLLLVDYPGLNLILARVAARHDIPVLYYISPKIWASRAERIHALKESVSHMAVIIPFEKQLFDAADVPCTYVGNPLQQQIDPSRSRQQSRDQLGLEPEQICVGLLPGSRKGEVTRLLPLLLDSAARLQQQGLSSAASQPTQWRFLIPRATSLDPRLFEQFLAPHSGLSVQIVDGQSHDVMRASDALVVASGTATLEAALIGTPQVLVYKLGAFNYRLVKRKLLIQQVGLVNVVAQKAVVRELLQDDATADAVAGEVKRLLEDHSYRQQMLDAYAAIAASLEVKSATRSSAAETSYAEPSALEAQPIAAVTPGQRVADIARTLIHR